MKRQTTALILTALALLTGCQKAPDNGDVTIHNPNLIYATPAEIAEKYNTIENDTDNFIFEGELLIPDSFETVKQYQSTAYAADLEATADVILGAFYGEEFDKKYYSQSLSEEYIDYIKDDGTHRASFSKSGGNYMCLSRHAGLGLKITNDVDYNPVRTYNVNRDCDTTDSYLLSGQNYSIGEAVKYAESWAKEFWSEYEPQFDFKARTITVRPAPSDFDENGSSFTYEIVLEKMVDNIPIDAVGHMFSKEVTLFNSPVVIKMTAPDEVYFFCCNGITQNETKTCEKILTPQSAFEAASEFMAGYNKLVISYAYLKYAITESGAYFPVWAFEIDTDSRTAYCRSIYVDAVTGDVYAEMEYEPHL